VAEIARQFAHRDALVVRLDARPGHRFVRAALARHIEVRDRTCSHPGCRRPARKSDKDHTHDHARGGATTSRNIGPGCDRHHLYKHEGGWCLRQPEPGHFVWTSPLGRAYRSRGAPISPPVVAPCPAPSDPGRPSDEPSGRFADNGSILSRPAPARPPPRPQPQQPVDLDDLRLSDTDCLGIGTDIATRARSDVPAR
jgi:hypothetical protein